MHRPDGRVRTAPATALGVRMKLIGAQPLLRCTRMVCSLRSSKLTRLLSDVPAGVAAADAVINATGERFRDLIMLDKVK